MPFQLLINFLIAFIWMFLSNSFDGVSFIVGYIIGLAILYFLRRFLPGRFYMKNVAAFIKLLLIFIRELILSNVTVIKQILKPNLDIKPGIFALPTILEKDWQITALACLITLTPGTLSLVVSDDRKLLYIHAMDIPDTDKAIADIKNSFEKAILEVSK